MVNAKCRIFLATEYFIPNEVGTRIEDVPTVGENVQSHESDSFDSASPFLLSESR